MKNGKFLIAPLLLWLGIFFAIPLLIVVVVSFAGRTPYGQVIFNWTLENYVRFFEPLYLSIFADTLWVAVLTTVFTLVSLSHLIPMLSNFLIRSFAWVIILRSQGVLNTLLIKLGFITAPLQLLYNDTAVMVGMVYSLLPFMVLPIYVSLEQLDRRLLEAAYDLGATPFTAFRKITLPLTLSGISEGTILVFISSLGMFIVPEIMGGAKAALVGNLIQNQFLSARNWPFGSALSIVLAILSLVLITIYYKALAAGKGGGKDA